MVSVEYLAGFIDGEGSLSLSRIPRGHSYYEYCVRVSIANTNKAVLREIREDWGGTIHCMGRSRPRRWKPGFVLIWTNAAAARLLVRVRPHLWLKSDHANYLLDFAEHIRECQRRRDELGRLLSFSRQEKEIREAYWRRLKRLNRRGTIESDQERNQELDYDRRRRGRGEISPRYLAGFIDGEGSLMITKSKSGKSGYVQYRARMSVSNTDKGILEQICHRFGGTIHTQRRANPRWKPAYMLVWTEGRIASLLALIGPHLRLKRKQAELQLEFMQHKKRTPRSFDGRFLASHPPGVIQVREALYQHMKRLNARGVAPS